MFAALEGGGVGDDAGSSIGEGFVDVDGRFALGEHCADELVGDEGVGTFVA